MNIYTKEFLRFQALDKCFRDKTKDYFIEDLTIACNKAVQENYPTQKNTRCRSIYLEIEKMRKLPGFNESIEKIRKLDQNKRNLDFLDPQDQKEISPNHTKEAYSYKENNSFSLSNNNLNDLEAAQMREAISVMSRIKGRPGYESLNEVILKLEKEIMGNKQLPVIMSYDENKYLKGLKHLEELIGAIKDKLPLKLFYKSYKSEEEEKIIVYPYYLKQYNKRWFLFGNRKDQPDPDYVPQFAIDRINKIDPCHPEKEKFIESTVDIEEYLKHVIGVSTNFHLQPQNIILKFHPNRYDYAKTKPPHEIKFRDDINKTLQIRVVHNKELEQLILSYGADVKVISPPTLKNRIKDIIDKMANNYKNGQQEITGNGVLPE